jgi:hypothetical protein
MKIKLLLGLFLTFAIAPSVAFVIAYALFQTQGNGTGGGLHAVPGPQAGAGLPFIAVGYGAYWLIRGRRKAN